MGKRKKGEVADQSIGNVQTGLIVLHAAGGIDSRRAYRLHTSILAVVC